MAGDPIRDLEQFVANLQAETKRDAEAATLDLLKMLRHLTHVMAEALGGTIAVLDKLDKPANVEHSINRVVETSREVLLVWKGLEASLDPTIAAIRLLHEESSEEGGSARNPAS